GARLVAARFALTFLGVVFLAAARFGVAFCGAARRRVDFVAVARVPDVLARAVPLRAARDVLFVPALFVAVPLVALLLVAVLAPPRFVAALVLPFAAAMSAPLVVWRLAATATHRRRHLAPRGCRYASAPSFCASRLSLRIGAGYPGGCGRLIGSTTLHAPAAR